MRVPFVLALCPFNYHPERDGGGGGGGAGRGEEQRTRVRDGIYDKRERNG